MTDLVDLRNQQELSDADLRGLESFVGVGVGNSIVWYKLFIHKLISLAREEAVVTAEQIKDLLETLTGNNRLDVAFVKNAVTAAQLQALADIVNRKVNTSTFNAESQTLRTEIMDALTRIRELEGFNEGFSAITAFPTGVESKDHVVGTKFDVILQKKLVIPEDVDNIRIFAWEADRSALYVVHQENWTETSDKRIFRFDIDATEYARLGVVPNVGELNMSFEFFNGNVSLASIDFDIGIGRAVSVTKTQLDEEGVTRKTADDALSARVTALENAPAPSAGTDNIARRGVAENRELIQALEAKEIAARLRIFPQAFDSITNLRGNHIAVIDELQQDLLFDDVTAKPVRKIRLVEEESDTTVHTENWQYSPIGDQIIDFEISAQEATDIGNTGDITTWKLYFLAQDDSILAQTNTVVTPVGKQLAYPATKGEVNELGVNDPRRLLSTLDWDVQPTRISGRDVSDFEQEFRIDFQFPALDISAYFYEIHIGTETASQRVGARAKWAGATHLTFTPTNAEATTIAGFLDNDDDHAEVKLLLFALERGGGFVAGASRRILILPEASDGLSQRDQIGLLKFRADPSSFTFDSLDDFSAELRAIDVAVENPQILEGDIWVQASTSGVGSLARRKWTNNTRSLNLAINALNADAIADNRKNESDVELQFTFYDAANGGNVVGTSHINLPIIFLSRPVEKPAFAAVLNLDANKGKTFEVTLTANITSLNVIDGEDGDGVLVYLKQDGTGNRTAALNNAIQRPGGIDEPVLSTAANALDLLAFQKINNAWRFLGILNNV